MASAQVNMRVPDEAREILLAVGARLRADPTFADQLQRFLDGVGDKSLADRVAALEARLDAVEGGTP
tara:strand:- start:9406 stop:9606 length:201 start_codon:yes stop_codon:yes gene_type:complete